MRGTAGVFTDPGNRGQLSVVVAGVVLGRCASPTCKLPLSFTRQPISILSGDRCPNAILVLIPRFQLVALAQLLAESCSILPTHLFYRMVRMIRSGKMRRVHTPHGLVFLLRHLVDRKVIRLRDSDTMLW